MTEEQRRAIADGQRRAWADPEVRAVRSLLIRKGLNDPRVRAHMRRIKIKPGSRRHRRGDYDGVE